MMIHLEAGTCASGVGRDQIDEWAFYWDGMYTNQWNAHYRYKCPTCNENFRFVSALLQHVESQACGHRMDGCIGDMVDYLEDQIRDYWN